MIYSILIDADKHWGALKAEEQYRSAYFLKELIKELPIDLYVSAGDFFDTKLLLNSKASIFAIRDMHERVAICREKGIPCRVIQGTYSHDYDQLDAFSTLMADPANQFRYFTHMTIEETLPGLRIMYGTDENVNFTKYVNRYFDDIIAQRLNMGIMHGNFDSILPDVALKVFNAEESSTLVYNYRDLNRHIHGPIIAGHWHEAYENESLFYVGSADRWIFGEDEPKGYLLIQYDTETEMYKAVRIINPLAPIYKTFPVHTSAYKTIELYAALGEAIEEELKNDDKMRIRILVIIDKMLLDTEENLNQLKFRFSNERRVSITVKNKIREAEKTKKKEESRQMDITYGFIRDKNMETDVKIREWIRIMIGREYPQEEISKYIKPLLTNS